MALSAGDSGDKGLQEPEAVPAPPALWLLASLDSEGQ